MNLVVQFKIVIPTGSNFTNILGAAFTPADPKCAKMPVNSSNFFLFSGSAGVKAASKHVDEIDPRRRFKVSEFQKIGSFMT